MDLNKHPHSPAPDPTKSSKTWAIALIVSALFLLAAAGIIIWLVISRSAPAGQVSIQAPPDDTKNVKNVSLLPPADFSADYVKNDQSKVGETTVFYYNEATNCGITVGVVPINDDRAIKAIAEDAVAAAQAQGVTTTKTSDGQKYDLKDTDGSKTYTFDSIDLEQQVKVEGVNFTGQQNTIAYKQFGSKAAFIGFACKTETWADKKAELATLITTFTVKTER